MDGLTTVPYLTMFLRKWQFLFQKCNLIFNVIFFCIGLFKTEGLFLSTKQFRSSEFALKWNEKP
jgi:hypothetical protein